MAPFPAFFPAAFFPAAFFPAAFFPAGFFAGSSSGSFSNSSSAIVLSETVATSYQLGGGPAPVEIWGDVAGRLIWSTSWNAFVSGVVTARINQRFEAVPGSGVEDARITAAITTRIRVRP